MVIFHSYVSLPEGKSQPTYGKGRHLSAPDAAASAKASNSCSWRQVFSAWFFPVLAYVKGYVREHPHNIWPYYALLI